jgi:hypothetical protein
MFMAARTTRREVVIHQLQEIRPNFGTAIDPGRQYDERSKPADVPEQFGTTSNSPGSGRSRSRRCTGKNVNSRARQIDLSTKGNRIYFAAGETCA